MVMNYTNGAMIRNKSDTMQMCHAVIRKHDAVVNEHSTLPTSFGSIG